VPVLSALALRRPAPERLRYASSFRSRRSFATCPVARTLYWANAT
jgi:hypothetical protein